jgi:hypothetical protein
MRQKTKSLLRSAAAKWGLHLLAALAMLLLFSSQIVNAQQATDAPTTDLSPGALSGIDIIEAQEAQDEANGTIDSRSEPYIEIQYIALDHQTFLPMVAGGSEASVEVQSAAEGMPWPPSLSPDFKLTDEEKVQQEAAHADAAAYVQSMVNAQVSAAGAEANNAVNAVVRSSATLGGINTTKEVNDGAHVNYCGPASIRVALDATLSSSSLPSQDSIATVQTTKATNLYSRWVYVRGQWKRGFDASYGTYGEAMCGFLHDYYIQDLGFPERYLSTPFYSTSQQTLWNEIIRHVGKNYAITTGSWTFNLKQWNHGANHISAILGYDADLLNGWYPATMYQVRYAETAGSIAGYQGNEFKIWWPGTSFWTAVSANNVQCFLKAGV